MSPFLVIKPLSVIKVSLPMCGLANPFHFGTGLLMQPSRSKGVPMQSPEDPSGLALLMHAEKSAIQGVNKGLWN